MKLFSKSPSKETNVSSEDYLYKRLEATQVSNNVDDNIKVMNETFNQYSGVIRRELTCGKNNIKILIIFVDGMIDKDLLDKDVIKPIVNSKELEIGKNDFTTAYVKEKIITSSEIVEAVNFDSIVYELLSGSTIIFIDGCNSALVISNNDIKGRNIDKTDSEQTVRGSKEAFVENIHTNLVLIRKRLKTPDLAVEMLNIGKRSKTIIALVYINGITNPELIGDIKKEISKIKIDGILGSGQIEQFIQKHKFTVFPQMLTTERVDRIVGSLLEGRAAIIVDGTPFSLIVPTTFSMLLNTMDDYFGRTIITSLLRILRYFGFWGACSISATYLALTTYHPGLIPTGLALSITGTRVGLPFPVVFEIITMEFALYLIQEAAIRLPRFVGQTIGIVGGLVLGQAVVQAGIVSPIIVIVVSISALSSFTLPSYTLTLATIVIRLFLIFCAAFFGLYGVALGAIVILIHAASLENFGVKYLEDYSPFNAENLKDTFIFNPRHTKRPDYLNTVDTIRQTPDSREDDNE